MSNVLILKDDETGGNSLMYEWEGDDFVMTDLIADEQFPPTYMLSLDEAKLLFKFLKKRLGPQLENK